MGHASLLRLLQTFDSAFPSGAFAFSNGLEVLNQEIKLLEKIDLKDILLEQFLPRWFEFDRFFIRKAFEAGGNIADLLELDKKCHIQNSNAALAASSRRIGRSLLSVHIKIGTAGAFDFWDASSKLILNEQRGYQPIVIGLVGWGLQISRKEVEIGAVYGVLSSFFSAAVRLGLMGAIEAQGTISEVIPEIDRMLEDGPPDFAYSNAILSEIAASRHKDLEISLFSN